MVHEWRLDLKDTQRTNVVGERSTLRRYRFVCTCGFRTRWRSQLSWARTERDCHALDGQQSAEM